jgi:hypothetical protein
MVWSNPKYFVIVQNYLSSSKTILILKDMAVVCRPSVKPSQLNYKLSVAQFRDIVDLIWQGSSYFRARLKLEIKA